MFEFQECCNAKVTEPREHLPAQLKPLFDEFWWSRTLAGKQYYNPDVQKKVQKLMLSFPIAPPSAIHTLSRNSHSIPDLMLLQEQSPPAPPWSLSLPLPSPVPGGAIQPWLSRASPETHTQNVHSAKTPDTQTQTSSRPEPRNTNKMQDAALCSFSFSNLPPHGITHHRGKSSASNWSQ